MKNQSIIIWAGRISLFIIFFWFGLLKVLSLSPAEQLVKDLHAITLSSIISGENFVILLGVFECWIGILWLLPKLTKFAFVFFLIQMFTTFLPLFFLPKDTWNGIALSLVGQYIVKNIALIALAAMIFLTEKEKNSQSNISLT